MRRLSYFATVGVALVCLSAILFAVNYLIFRDLKDLTFYLWLDVIFLPVQVLIVTLIIDRFLAANEKRALLTKLNMVIGAFFSEMGTDLLDRFHAFDLDEAATLDSLSRIGGWDDEEFTREQARLRAHEFRIDSRRGDLAGLKGFLGDKRDFILRLFENPNLLEHESFTNLLWAVSHLAEEFHQRHDLTRLPAKDLEHLSGDIKRAYGLLLVEWLAYMRHLKTAYPYLFSLAVRTNPFDPDASVEVK